MNPPHPDEYNNCGIYVRHKMPTRPKPTGIRVHAGPVQDCPLQVVSEPLFTSRSHTEVNSPSSPPHPTPTPTSHPTPRVRQLLNKVPGWLWCLSLTLPVQTLHPHLQPSSQHPLPSDQTAAGRASGEGAKWGGGGDAAGTEPN